MQAPFCVRKYMVDFRMNHAVRSNKAYRVSETFLTFSKMEVGLGFAPQHSHSSFIVVGIDKAIRPSLLQCNGAPSLSLCEDQRALYYAHQHRVQQQLNRAFASRMTASIE
ncbi:hypothetical protein KIN20_005623 [Parelaphostrongylus tenuis]|uniref:Uncharacterized protein n=1 Tax=Parelaphostrongylus tenuis TaxID=148309 RepID=A0AAD5M2G0_PARTN|nr:hypothetical protein KIN20_005623 [Parelaphostrongylus tenuis]